MNANNIKQFLSNCCGFDSIAEQNDENDNFYCILARAQLDFAKCIYILICR